MRFTITAASLMVWAALGTGSPVLAASAARHELHGHTWSDPREQSCRQPGFRTGLAGENCTLPNVPAMPHRDWPDNMILG